MSSPPFPNYLQARRRIPVWAWWPIRVVSIAAYLAIAIGAFVRPAGGLFAFWSVTVPVLPLLFFIAPGLWRNICPLAAANQTPRVLQFSKALKPPRVVRERGYVAAVSLFLGIVAVRKLLFNTNGTALGVLLLVTIAAAFASGVLLKGKSGWCSSICPLLPVQRIYGQTPLVLVPNAHCQPCVGCAKNCYDFNPRVAYQADMTDDDAKWSAARKLFAGVFPGLVIGYFTLSAPPQVSDGRFLVHLGASVLISSGLLFAADVLLPVPTSLLAALWGAAAINLFYWYGSHITASAISVVFGADVHAWLPWLVRGVVTALTVVWLVRTVQLRRRYIATVATAGQVRVDPASLRRRTASVALSSSEPVVEFEPDGEQLVVKAGETLLEVAERARLPIEAGCRLGVCGADPVTVVEGIDRLSPVEEDEANTLRRLGLADDCRMACSARVLGDCRVSLTATKAEVGAGVLSSAPYSQDVKSVVVIGGGVAGITTADFVRRMHPECEIHVVGREAHAVYNRMGISRLIYGRSAMHGLYLLPEEWCEEHRITCWLNTIATRIELAKRVVVLGTGERLSWDRLVLAMGSSAFVPALPGFGTAGTFVVREADDGIRIRAHVQRTGARSAVVAGGGLLGLEAAHALVELGLQVTVVERGDRLLARFVDARTSELLQSFLANAGIRVRTERTAASVSGDGQCHAVTLDSGEELPADVFVVAAGITPNAELAAAAGIVVNRGVVVDDTLRTSAPDVFGVGDVAEVFGAVHGLWPVAVSQAEVAAANVVGGERHLEPYEPVAILKGVGIDLAAAGRIDGCAGDEVIVGEEAARHVYRKLVLRDGKVVGGIVLGVPGLVPRLTSAVRHNRDVSTILPRLRAGRWELFDSDSPHADRDGYDEAPSTSRTSTRMAVRAWSS
ncbi:MAG TPA: FAD-dependent oxidoreductase [Jatrophihabitans sp.]|nr:FAD-dependent oxidoreductase [Jatrophihabitans sp.]